MRRSFDADPESSKHSVADLLRKMNGGRNPSPPGPPRPAPPHAEPPRPEPPRAEPPRADPPRTVPPRSVTSRGGGRGRRAGLRAGQVVVAMAAAISLLVTGVVWGYLKSTDGQYTRIDALDQDSVDVRDPGGQYGDENYLIVGTDSRAGGNSKVGAGTTADADGARSDVVILVNIPANRSRVVAVSFPRDLNVTRPTCTGWDNDKGEYTGALVASESDVKLNGTYAVGGPKCLVKVIQKMSGLKVNHFVGMDFSGFESMVDTVGGVTVCTTMPLVDDELGTVLRKAGPQRINGKTALNYVRARKVEAEGNGDYGRIKRQQMFLSSLLRAALSNKVLLDPGKLNGFISAFTHSAFGDNLDTQALLKLGQSLQSVDAGAVTFLTVPTSGTDDYGNETPRLQDIENIFNAIIDDDPLPGEKKDDEHTAGKNTTEGDAAHQAADTRSLADRTAPPRSSATLTAVSPSSVSVQVRNATKRSGVAGTAADALGDEGFQIANIGDYTHSSDKTIVQFSGGNEAEAATVASALPGAVLQRTDDLDSVVEVVIGTDFAGRVRTPASYGTEVHPVIASDSNDPGSLPADLSVTNAADTTCG
ncbi:LCP family protein [Corynebacteriales bacterium D3-21]|uniref:LCP family protein n=1 Tax=Speluncibacter jeojiensis TaxID=2710754 RepID=A0A9X4M5W9_9ACTN|nr:LCP family protein [Corynebacteriales bacterium D3-21]